MYMFASFTFRIWKLRLSFILSVVVITMHFISSFTSQFNDHQCCPILLHGSRIS